MAGEVQTGKEVVASGFDSAFVTGAACPQSLGEFLPISDDLKRDAAFIPNCKSLTAGLRLRTESLGLVRLGFGVDNFSNIEFPPRAFNRYSLEAGLDSHLQLFSGFQAVVVSHAVALQPTLVRDSMSQTSAALNLRIQDGLGLQWPGVIGGNIVMGQTVPLFGSADSNPYQIFIGFELDVPAQFRKDEYGATRRLASASARTVAHYQLGINARDAWKIPGLASSGDPLKLEAFNALLNTLPGTIGFQESCRDLKSGETILVVGGGSAVGALVMALGVNGRDSALVGSGNYLLSNSLACFSNDWKLGALVGLADMTVGALTYAAGGKSALSYVVPVGAVGLSLNLYQIPKIYGWVRGLLSGEK